MHIAWKLVHGKLRYVHRPAQVHRDLCNSLALASPDITPSYLSIQRSEWVVCTIADRLMTTDAVLRVDICRPVVEARLADVAVGDGPDFRTVPVAVGGTLASPTA